MFAPSGRLRLYNQAFAAIWQLNPGQLDGEPHVDEIIGWCRALYDAPEEWERTKAAVTAIVAERHPYESQIDRPDGSVLACAALPLPDGGTLLTYVDVSDSKRVERALIERTEALEAADRLKTAFISHVSYELRTPLTNIIGFSELLASPIAGPLTEKQHDYLGDIRLSGRTLLAIVDDILDLATIDAGALDLKLSQVKVRDVFDQAVQGVEERLKQNDVALYIGIEPGIHSFVADGKRVTQILYNLLSNAIGFSTAGSRISLDLRAHRFHARLHDRGSGRGHPGRLPAGRVRPLRKPIPWLAPPRRRPRPLHRQEPCRAAWRARQPRLRRQARERASPCSCRSSRRRKAKRRNSPCSSTSQRG